MKKGMSTEGAIVIIVIFGVVMIIMAILYNTLFDVGEKEFTKRQCQLSLQLTKAVDGITNVKCLKLVDNPIPLKCPRRFLEVSSEDVLRDGESVKYQYNPSCSPQATLIATEESEDSNIPQWGGKCLPENVFASEMEYCWSMFLEGTFPVFQQVEPSVFTFFDDDDHSRACFVCSEILLNANTDVADFTKYLKEKYRRPKVASQDPSYFSYLARNRHSMCAHEIRDTAPDGTCWSGMGETMNQEWYKNIFGAKDWPGIDQDTIKNGKKYAVTFVRQGMTSCRPEENTDDVGMPTMTVQLIPAESMKDYCDMVMV